MKIWKSTVGKSLPSVRVTGILVSAVLALLVVSSAFGDEVLAHVAPTGDDADDGSPAKPVASLMGARDAVRRLRAEGKAGPVRVVVGDGTYRVAEPLVLTPEDGGSAEAPVRYEAAPGARPVFSGGRKITGFRRGENGLWVADVPGVAEGQWYFEQLWVDGHRARRAMEPDTGQLFFENVTESKLSGSNGHQLTVTVSPQVISLLTPLSPAQRADVKLLMFHSWSNTHRFINDIDAGSRSIRCEGPQVIRPWNKLKDLAWGWGLYTDEGSSNIRFENNLVYNVTDGGFHQHYGRNNTVRNNILAFSEQEQVRGTVQQKAGNHLSFTFERNIVYFDQGELFGRTWQWGPDVQVNLKNNSYWRAGGQRFDFAGKSWDQWRAMDRDKEGAIIADPEFVEPENYDFRFASDEVIKQIGFQSFDYSKAGVYGDATWIARAKATPDSKKEN
jgi:parallel beta-helix repeat protein